MKLTTQELSELNYTDQVTDNNALTTLKDLFRGHVGQFHIDVRKSKGSYAYLANEGRSVLDMNQHLASRPLGYNHPIFNSEEYKDLMALYSGNKLAYSTYFTTDFAKAAKVIEELYLKPSGFDRMFTVAGGAKAVEVAVHIAIMNKVLKNMHAGKGEIGNAVISLFGGYHGRGLGFRSLTTSIPDKNEYLPLFDHWQTVDPPKSEEEVARALQELEDKVNKIGAEHVACFVVEDMIQCGWGDRYIPASFLNGVRKIADKYDFYMVNDAVQTGMYASGKPFAHQALGAAQPDIIAGCKKSAVGYVLVKDKILEVEGNAIDSTISINSTFGGNAPDMITWAYVLQAMQNDNLISNIEERGAQMKAGLEKIASKYDEITNPRGLGLIGCALSAPSGELLGKITKQCYKNGLMIFPGTTPAPDGYAIRYRPVLDVTEEEIAETLRITDQSLEEVLKG